jgi:hypothetical protein
MGLFFKNPIIPHPLRRRPCRRQQRQSSDRFGEFSSADAVNRLVTLLYILAKGLTRITNRDVQRGDHSMRGLGRQEIESTFYQLEALGWLSRTPRMASSWTRCRSYGLRRGHSSGAHTLIRSPHLPNKPLAASRPLQPI